MDINSTNTLVINQLNKDLFYADIAFKLMLHHLITYSYKS